MDGCRYCLNNSSRCVYWCLSVIVLCVKYCFCIWVNSVGRSCSMCEGGPGLVSMSPLRVMSVVLFHI